MANMTLGDDLVAVLTGLTAVAADNAAIAAAQRQLNNDSFALASAQESLGAAMKAAGVAAILAPSPNADGTMSIAVSSPNDPGFIIVLAVPASTPIPDKPAPVPVPAPAPPTS